MFPSFSARGSVFLRKIGIWWLSIRFLRFLEWNWSQYFGKRRVAHNNSFQISIWKSQKVWIQISVIFFSRVNVFSRKAGFALMKYFLWWARNTCRSQIVQLPSEEFWSPLHSSWYCPWEAWIPSVKSILSSDLSIDNPWGIVRSNPWVAHR